VSQQTRKGVSSWCHYALVLIHESAALLMSNSRWGMATLDLLSPRMHSSVRTECDLAPCSAASLQVLVLCQPENGPVQLKKPVMQQSILHITSDNPLQCLSHTLFRTSNWFVHDLTLILVEINNIGPILVDVANWSIHDVSGINQCPVGCPKNPPLAIGQNLASGHHLANSLQPSEARWNNGFCLCWGLYMHMCVWEQRLGSCLVCYIQGDPEGKKGRHTWPWHVVMWSSLLHHCSASVN